MLWSLEIVFSIFFGYELTTIIAGPSIDVLARLGISIPIGFTAFCLVGAYITHNQIMNHVQGLIIVSIFMFASIILNFFNRFQKIPTIVKVHPVEIVTILAATIFISILFSISWCYNIIMFRSDVFQDFRYHDSIIQSVLIGTNVIREKPFNFKNPFISNTELVCKNFHDLHIALLYGTGYAPQRFGRNIPAFLLIFSIMTSFYYLSYEITRSHLASVISVYLLIHLGGTIFINRFFYEYYRRMNREEAYMYKNDFMWFHIVTKLIIQKPYVLYSLQSVFWSMYCLIKGKNKHPELMTLAGIISSIIILYNPHSYISNFGWSFMYIAILLLVRPKRKLGLINISFYLFFALILPVHQVYLNVKHIIASQQIKKIKFWMGYQSDTFYFFWLRTLLLFGVYSVSFVFLPMHLRQYWIYIPSIAIFAMFNFIKLQYEHYDNLLYFTCGWFSVACPLVSQFLAKLLTYPRKKFFKFICFCLFSISIFSMSASSMILYQKVVAYSYTPQTKVETELKDWILENISPESIIAISETSNNPVTFLGYQSYLSDYNKLLNEGYNPAYELNLTKYLNNGYNEDLFANQSISYYIEDRKYQQRFSGNAPFWSLVFESSNYKVWQSLMYQKTKNHSSLFVK